MVVVDLKPSALRSWGLFCVLGFVVCGQFLLVLLSPKMPLKGFELFTRVSTPVMLLRGL